MGFTPLTEFTEGEIYRYQLPGGGQVRRFSGGLYDEGSNNPPKTLRKAAATAASLVQPLGRSGFPAPARGLIGMVSVGMSNTHIEFDALIDLVGRSPGLVNPRLVMVNGAQGGKDAPDWILRDFSYSRDNAGTYAKVLERIDAAGLTPEQVQVVWLKQAHVAPSNYPDHVLWLERHLTEIRHRLLEFFPNIRLIYVSSRIYAGYADGLTNPEPYAYESAFAVRNFILNQPTRDWHQYQGRFDPDLDTGDAFAHGVALWGPYMWADGLVSRGDGLSWTCADFRSDGMHPSGQGAEKVARRLLDFFLTDRSSTRWFVAN